MKNLLYLTTVFGEHLHMSEITFRNDITDGR